MSTDIAATLAAARAVQELLPSSERSKFPPPSQADEQIIAKLEALDPHLAISFTQVLMDLSDASRLSYMGTAGELREVMRASIHKLAPDKDVKVQSWFKGDDKGRPTQAERIRFAAQGSSAWETARDSAQTIEERVGALGRRLYGRASKALHAGTQREEVGILLNYVRAVLADVLP